MVEQVATDLERDTRLLVIELLAPGDRPPDEESVKTMMKATGILEIYWSTLEPSFNRLVVALAEIGTDTIAINHDWTKLVCKTAQMAFTEAINGLHLDARTLRAATKAQRLLAGRLRTLITPYEEVNHAATK